MLICGSLVLMLGGAGKPGLPPVEEKRPNIVLVVFEDMSPRVGAFGDPVAHTPVLDHFAESGIRYPNSFTVAGVCAPSRAALITGVYQQTLGAQHMRTKGSSGFKGGGPIEYEAVPPATVKAFPELLRRAGYYTINNGKTDYQFGAPFTIWDRSGADATWRDRAPGQPFFAMFNLLKTHESYIWPEETTSTDKIEQRAAARNKRDLAGKVEFVQPADVVVPSYLPDTKVVRQDIARHYNNIAFQEQEITGIIDDLREDGLLDNTVIMITTDHGDGLPRMKRTVYDSGIRAPLMVRMPGRKKTAEIRDDLVSFVDISATILSFAGIERPDYMRGVPFLGLERATRTHVFAAADRHDFLKDKLRAVRDGRYKYIRNEMPEHALLRHHGFRDHLPTMKEIWRLASAGGLTELQNAYLQAPRPSEELYDTLEDPEEVNNLAGDPEYAGILDGLRRKLDAWKASLGPYEDMDEKTMVMEMWPGGIQPVTGAPVFSFVEGDEGRSRVRIDSPTAGASIGYRLGTDPADHWRLYNGPVALLDGGQVTAKAIRYGYQESAVAIFGSPAVKVRTDAVTGQPVN